MGGPGPLAQRAGPFLPLLNTLAVPINAAQGCKNGREELAAGRTLEGGARRASAG